MYQPPTPLLQKVREHIVDYDEAFVWFERAYQEQSNILLYLKVHPFFDPVRDDPRFKNLAHRVGLN